MDKQKVVNKKIGELLVERGVITKDQLNEALKAQVGKEILLGEILIEMGYTTEEEVMACLTTQYGVPYLSLEQYDISPEIINFVPSELVRKYNFIPIDKIGKLLTIATADIVDGGILSDLEKKFNCKIQLFVTTPSGLKKAIDKYYK